MYSEEQTIRTPFGITAFGSAIVRIEPDVAVLHFAVARMEKRPKDAFENARKAARTVREFLSRSGISDVGSSRVTLSQEYQYSGGERRFTGYSARIGFSIVLSDLDRVEEILIGVVDAGANEVESVSFQSRRLKEVRAEARRRAVEAAREKALNYCVAAGVELGALLHLQDVNPDILTGRNEGHVTRQMEPDDSGEIRAFDPGSITVGGAVVAAYAILAPSPTGRTE